MEQQLFDVLMVAMPLLAIVVFIALFFVKAGYGLFRTDKWGFSIDNKIAWVCMEAPVFFVMLFLWWRSSVRFEVVPLICFLLFELHYFQRLSMGIVFNLLNGFMQGEWLFYLAPDGMYSAEWLSRPCFWIGVLVFLMGMIINWHSDHVIRSLRKPGDTKHYLPVKGMYKYVTSGNYFGEFLEWVGFAVLTASPAAWVFVLWTFANLAPRAHAIRNRYREEFGREAVGNRKRMIPFIY